ncbi:MAG: Ig-like domain-containing protein [bacterium]|nr:Ig-like domain-containing protein [bacterium]
MKGVVTEANLAGVSVNDKPVGVVPGAAAGEHAFSATLPLTRGVDQRVTVSARDFAGNLTSVEWDVILDSNLVIEVITPRDGAELESQGAPMDAPVSVRVPGVEDGDLFTVSLDGCPATSLARTGVVGNGVVTVDGADGAHLLKVIVEDSDGVIQASAETRFSVADMAADPLAVERIRPENGATGVEPNEFIAVYFNKQIDPALLQIEVLETVHGMTYASPADGAEIAKISQVELIEVHRDRALMVGEVSHFPGDRMTAFYPDVDAAYGATIFITVLYDGVELARAFYEVRPLPSFIEGFVLNTLAVPAADVEVAIEKLGLTTITDSAGAFGFGFNLPASRTIPPGRHILTVNPGMKNRNFGTVQKYITVQEGRLNAAPPILLPALSTSIPFQRIVSGDAQILLGDGALELDLSQAELTFPDQRDQGDVHVQVLSIGSLTHAALASARPHWVYCLQPMGVEVSGPVGVQMEIPAHEGSHGYLEYYGDRVVLVGLDPDALMIIPAGVGLLDPETQRVTSEGVVELKRLDYIGYVLMTEAAQPLLEQYANGEIDLRRMISELEKL